MHNRTTMLSSDFDVRVLQSAAVRGEVFVSFARVVFCSLILGWFAIFGGFGQSRAVWLTCGTVGGCLLTSVAALGLARRGHLSHRWIAISPLLDACVCFVAILPSVIWVGPTQMGFLHQPAEMAVVILVTSVAGLRLLPTAAVLGGVANFVCTSILVSLDVYVGNASLETMFADILLYLLILVACVVVTVFMSIRTRGLVLLAAKGTRRSERAQQGLESLMREHHDVRAVLSAAAINSSMVLRELIQNSKTTGELKEVAQDLREDLREATRAIHRVKQQAYAELTTLTDVVEVDVRPALERVVNAVRRRFSEVEIVWEAQGTPMVAAVVGGAEGLERIVSNLMTNACEGDGTSVATRVELVVECGANETTITVVDNGPGFPPIALMQSRAGYPTTKPDGSGLGLLMVEGLIQASGGHLKKDNVISGGARVRVTLLQRSPK